MKHIISYIFLLVILLSSCDSSVSDARQLQETLNQQEHIAMQTTNRIASLLRNNSLDSLYMIDFSQSNAMYYVFNEGGIIFWSDNWLSISLTRLEGYDRWYYQKFDNAHTICRWTSAGDYSIVTIIPIKYAYLFENQWLQNTYISPFDINQNMDIIPLLSDEHLAIYTEEGNYLFSLKPREEIHQNTARVPVETPNFSYYNLFGGSESKTDEVKSRAISWMLVIMSLLFVLIIIIWAIIQIIKYRHLRNLPLRYKIFFWFSLLLLFTALYAGFMTRALIRDRHVAVQKQMLKDKSSYLQVALKSRVAYMTTFSAEQWREFNLDLKELSVAYKTDIHVYDLSGNLVGTSLPEIFDNGLHGRRIVPQMIFRNGHNQGRLTFDEPLIQYEYIGQMRYMAGYIPCINWDDIQIGYICLPLYVSETMMQESVNNVLLKIVPAYFVVLILLVVLSVLISRALTYPISQLSNRLRTLDPTKKNEKLQYEGYDEIGDLVDSYNKMIDDLNRNVMSLTEKEREAAWQTMSRQVAHEIKNPLTPMRLSVQQLQRAKEVGGERFDRYFDKATTMLIDQIDTLSQIAGSFSAFAKNMPEEINLNTVDVAQKLNMSVMMYSNYVGLSIRYIGPEEGVMVYADVDQIGRVFTNIIQNAVQAMENQDNKDIIVMLKQDKEWVEISISDNGPGIDEELRDKIFLPNFTTKTTGMGLGLAMCKNIVGRSGGEVWYESSLGKGTTFFVKLRMA